MMTVANPTIVIAPLGFEQSVLLYTATKVFHSNTPVSGLTAPLSKKSCLRSGNAEATFPPIKLSCV